MTCSMERFTAQFPTGRVVVPEGAFFCGGPEDPTTYRGWNLWSQLCGCGARGHLRRQWQAGMSRTATAIQGHEGEVGLVVVDGKTSAAAMLLAAQCPRWMARITRPVRYGAPPLPRGWERRRRGKSGKGRKSSVWDYGVLSAHRVLEGASLGDCFWTLTDLGVCMLSCGVSTSMRNLKGDPHAACCLASAATFLLERQPIFGDEHVWAAHYRVPLICNCRREASFHLHFCGTLYTGW